jgi:hypothetical protein
LSQLTLVDTLHTDGFAFVHGADMRPLLLGDVPDALSDFAGFAASWDDLHVDHYMADGGKYRRRRHALYRVAAGAPPLRLPHGPHWQSLEYNPLNGGIERWFEPITDAVGASRSLRTILEWAGRTFDAVVPGTPDWDVEVHQFRIEAEAGGNAKPTPEGIHRDGVDFVLVLLVQRRNIASGTTTIHDPTGRELGSFTLSEPFDAALIDDHRAWHGVTPVRPLDAALPAHRDVLVVTFKATR